MGWGGRSSAAGPFGLAMGIGLVLALTVVAPAGATVRAVHGAVEGFATRGCCPVATT